MKWLLLIAVIPLAAQPVSFERTVQPILNAKCIACHPATNGAAEVSLASFGDLKNLIIPGKPEDSPLWHVLRGPKPRMPKGGSPLTVEQQRAIETWIAEGAKDDSKDNRWWSLRPLQAGPHRSIDAYLRAALQKQSLTFSATASRRVRIRRLTFDLHGLPPTPEEISSFERDPRPDAYTHLVDRLLASPRYGERWARHWLDIVHYGDSHGYDKDKPRTNAWPYRDAVIRAFNQDLPYKDFVERQLAGDVLHPSDPHAIELTGFLAAGPWDFVGHQELKEGTMEKNQTRSLDRDDMVATAVSTFSSMTAHCARCHDHKFDPIPQEDYYRLQAVFAGIDRADRPYDEDPAIAIQRRDLLQDRLALQLRIQPLLDKVEFASTPEIVVLDDRIQDASLLLAHLGTPKTPEQQADKQRLEARRTADRAARQQLVDALIGATTYNQIEALKLEIKQLDDRLAALPKPKLVYAGTSFFNRIGNFRPALAARPVHVLDRGSVTAPRQQVSPGALRAVNGVDASFAAVEEGARRAAFARWVVNPGNVLTWRSIVNRVWHYHFGAGLVDSPSDFGRMGSQPSHPELLDWLALWFRDEAKGSFKQLHRLIVMSQAYQQDSKYNDHAARIDADNRLLWRMNRTKLDAESIRDAALAASGKLDLSMGGPGVRMFWFKDDHSPIYDYARFEPSSAGAYRRSIYRFIVRSVPDPFLERLDCPDPSVLTPKRSTTLTAIQALAMWNNPFMLYTASQLAARVGGNIQLAAQLVFGRELSATELQLYRQYADSHGMANLCRLLLNANEFLFVD